MFGIEPLFLLVPLLCLALASCQKPEPTPKPKEEASLVANLADVIFTADGGSQDVTITANNPWTASVSGTGFSVSPTSGDGKGKITITAAATSATDPVTGSVTVSSSGLKVTIKITQEGKKVLQVGDVIPIPAEGGSFTVDVQYNVDLEVVVADDAKDWITFVRTKAVTSGKLEFSFKANESGEKRTGKVVVRDSKGRVDPVILDFTQDGKAVLDVENPTIIPAEGGTFELNIKYSTDYEVVVDPDASSWIKYFGTKATKNGTMTFQVSANDTPEQRTGKVTVKDVNGKLDPVVLTFVQSDKKFIILDAPSNVMVNAEGGTFKFKVQYNTDYDVKVESSARSWISCVKTKALSNGEMEFSVTANTTTSQRTGKVTITDKSGKVAPIELTFIQQEKKAIIVDQPDVIPYGGATVSLNVQYNADYNVKIQDGASGWITCIRTKAMSQGVLQFQVAPNDNYDRRTGIVTLEAVDGSVAPVNITFVQNERPGLIVDKPSIIPAEGGIYKLGVQHNVQYGVDVTGDAKSWISCVSTKALTNGEIEFNIAPNTSNTKRMAVVNVYDLAGKLPVIVLNIEQEGMNSYASIDITRIETIYGTTSGIKNIVFNVNSSVTTDQFMIYDTPIYLSWEGSTLNVYTEASCYRPLSIYAFTFFNIPDLEYLDLSNFDFTDYGYFAWIFGGLKHLKGVNFGSDRIIKATDINSIFYGCSALETADLSMFDVSEVTDFKQLFMNCHSLKSVNLSGWDTSNATDMSFMFLQCSSLKEINVSHFNTSKVTNMMSMFQMCDVLERLDLSNFDTSSLEEMGLMFNDCYALEYLDLSSFNLKNDCQSYNALALI